MAFRARGGGGIAQKNWQSNCVVLNALDIAIGSASAVEVFQYATAQTILRTRGKVYLQLDAGGVDERVVVAMGLIIVSRRAAAIGVTALPLPDTNAEDDWLWYGYMVCSSLGEAAIQPDALFDRQEVDSKAMRKVKADESLVFVSEICTSLDVTGSVDVMLGVRQLTGS